MFRKAQSLILLQLIDCVRHSKILRTLNGIRHYMLSAIASDAKAANHLAVALGFSEHSVWDRRITASLMKRFDPAANEDLWARVVENLPRYRSLLKVDSFLSRSIILKAPGENGEKGVLLMYFEYNWVRLALGLSKEEFRWIDRHFDFVFSTSWSPTDYAALALLLAKCSGPVFVQPCNYNESRKLALFHPNLWVLDSLPCDWIDPAFYPPVPKSNRDIDFVMVANWGEFKRHWDFFTALKNLPADLKVVLIGQIEGGRNQEYIRQLAKRIGVPQQLEIYESLLIEEVAVLQMRAKVSVIFTRREGCCVASVESLFAGCALGMRDDAHVGPLAYINEQTGLRLRTRHLSEDLMRLLELSSSLEPEQWAKNHISCHQTHAKLNASLRQSCQRRGLPWTKDIALPHWRPYPKHANAADAQKLQSCYKHVTL